MAHSNSDFDRRMQRAGWTLIRKSKHQIWRCPCGRHQFVAPATYGRGRSYANTVAQLRRLGCPNTPEL